MPKAAVLLLGLIVSSPSWAAGMVSVAQVDGKCRTVEGYCYEWRLLQDETLRFVASGYEDGGDWSFYRRGEDGSYTHLFSVYPAMRDARHPGLLFWGYAWDISDVALSDGPEAVRLLVNFDHTFQYDGNWRPEKWQRAVPYVLFTGTATQPDIQVEAQTFHPMSIEEIRARAVAADPSKRR